MRKIYIKPDTELIKYSMEHFMAASPSEPDDPSGVDYNSQIEGGSEEDIGTDADPNGGKAWNLQGNNPWTE